MAEESINDFLSGLQGRLLQSTATQQTIVSKADQETQYICTPAPNPIEWTANHEFLDVDTVYYYTRQYQLIRDFFQLRCPLSSCNDQSPEARDCWGKGREYLQSENLLIYSHKYGEDVCPSCNSTRSELKSDNLLLNYNQMHAVIGMRAGKTATAAIIGTYIEHKILTIAHSTNDRLDRYFEQLSGQPFEMTFIASTEVQSADTIWAKFVGLRQNSPWMGRYIKWIKQKEVSQQTQNGAKPWEYRELDRSIEHGLLNLNIDSKNSSSSGLAGRTRLASFVDELARFENTDTARGGDEAYRVLENSLKTVRQKAKLLDKKEIPWTGTMVSISSPISDDDKAMRLLKQAPNIPEMYYAHYATWEFNPDYPRSAFDSDFAKDPIGAMRDFGARPPTVASPLITDPAVFRDLAIQHDLKPTAEFKKILHIDRTGREYISTQAFNAQLVRDGQRFIAFDAGSTFDSFAGACAHGEWVVTPEGKQLITVFDWVVRLLPESKPKREIWFDFVTNIIDYLSKTSTIGRVEFDRWQSTYLIQQIRAKGIPCERKSTAAEEFTQFVGDVTYSRVRMLPPMPADASLEPPFMSAQGLAFYELEHLERSTDLKKVHNPKKGMMRGYNSDDVATTIVHASHMVQSQVMDMGSSNSPSARLRREQSSEYAQTSGTGSIYRPRVSKRGW